MTLLYRKVYAYMQCLVSKALISLLLHMTRNLVKLDTYYDYN